MSTTIPHPETGKPVEVFVRIADKSAWTAAANGLKGR